MPTRMVAPQQLSADFVVLKVRGDMLVAAFQWVKQHIDR
jgi:hypothetical protein